MCTPIKSVYDNVKCLYISEEEKISNYKKCLDSTDLSHFSFFTGEPRVDAKVEPICEKIHIFCSDQVEISLPGCWNDQLRPPSWKYLKYYLTFCGNIIKGKMIKMLWWKIWQYYRNVKTNRRLNKIVRPLVWEGASNCTGYQISHSTSPSRWPATEE